jgi:hypothetical protein
MKNDNNNHLAWMLLMLYSIIFLSFTAIIALEASL